MKLGFSFMLLAVAGVYGCSGGGGGGADLVSGSVVGSVYRHAKVCYDTTGDGTCADESAFVWTDDNGKFSLAKKTGADLVAEIGDTTVRCEPSDKSTTTISGTAKANFRLHKDLISDQAVLSSISTQVSAEMDNGVTKDSAISKVADVAGVTTGKLLADFNDEKDATTKGLLKAHSDKMLGVLQSTTSVVEKDTSKTKVSLKETFKSVLTTPSEQKGSVKYVWTQIGANDDPFSKLEITGASSGGLGDTPNSNNASVTAITQLQSANAKLYSPGNLVARAIVLPDENGVATCPKIAIDGKLSAMSVRAAKVSGKLSNGSKYGSTPNVDFNVLTCESAIPANTASAAINGKPLKLLPKSINRVVVVGDTGCRLKGPTAFVQAADGTSSGGDPLQDCTDEAAWPWAKIAKVAAGFNPDLVIHNGDIHYREGFPSGIQKRWGGAANAANGGSEVDNDNVVMPKFKNAKIDDSINYGWRAWEEDFFKTSGPLLGVAPWAITRGNHELCDRAAQGWFRFLDPRKFPGGEPEYDASYVRGSSYSVTKYCSQYIDPVAMTVGDLQLVLLDASMMNSSEGLSSSKGATLLDHVRVARQLNDVSDLADSKDSSKISWVISHKPFFAYSGAAAAVGNAPKSAGADTWQLQKAINPGTESVANGNGSLPANTQMTHAGHIHGFQMISHPSASGLPISVLMGTTGDNLEGLIEANTGTAFAAKSWANNITSGAWPWFDQTIGTATATATKWYGNFAQYLPVNFSSSPITGGGKKETAVMTEFSFLVIDRIGSSREWKIQVYNKERQLLRTCTTSGKSAICDG